MDKLNQFKLAFSVAITTLAVSLGYEIKEAPDLKIVIPKWLIILLSLWVGNFASKFIIDQLIKLRVLRKVLLGEQWVEGIWVTTSYDEKGQVLGTGIIKSEYVGKDLSLVISGMALRDEAPNNQRVSISQVASLQSPELTYINYFKSGDIASSYLGIAIGRLIRPLSGKYPVEYRGTCYYLDTQKSEFEVAYKVDNRVLRRIQKEHPNAWKEELLKLASRAPLVLPSLEQS